MMGLLVADAELLCYIIGESLAVDNDVHCLTLDEVVGCIPVSFVLPCFTPRVLYHEELSPDLVLCDTIDHHTVVIGELIVIVALLAILLCRLYFGDVCTVHHLVDVVLSLCVAKTNPTCLVGSLGFNLFDIREDSNTISCEAFSLTSDPQAMV